MYIMMNTTKVLGQDQRYAINHKNKCYFVGKDLCVAMGYKNHNSILKKYVSDINKQKHDIATNKGVQNVTLLNEQGVHELLNHSCKQYAIELKELLSKKSFIEIINRYQEVSNESDTGGTQEVYEGEVLPVKIKHQKQADIFTMLKTIYIDLDIKKNVKIGLYNIDIYIEEFDLIIETTDIEAKKKDIERINEINFFINHKNKYEYGELQDTCAQFIFAEEGNEFEVFRQISLIIERLGGIAATDYMKKMNVS